MRWPWHDQFVAELRRTVAPHYACNVNPRRRRLGQRECEYDALLEWKFDTATSTSTALRHRQPPGT